MDATFRTRKAKLKPHRSLRLTAILAAAIFFLLTACSDNATKLSLAIEKAVRPGESRVPGSVVTVPYQPKARPAAPYTLIFFPEYSIGPESLEAAGVSRTLVERIYGELGYVGVGEQAMLVVFQEGERLNFTTHWRRFATAEDLLVLKSQGICHLELEERSGRWILRGLR